jgi:acetyl-CoA carboxylase biotin carboxyl carrier protein
MPPRLQERCAKISQDYMMAEKKGATSSPPNDSAMRVDPALVQQLAELLTANELTEIEVEDGDRKIRVARHVARNLLTSSPSFDALPVAPAPGVAQGTAQVAPAEAPAEEVSGETVKSPMVGTAFLAAQPGAKPFVEAGDTVKAGDTLLIVEAMKVMNPITAPSGGVVKKLLVSDGQPVEFDQPLVIIG